MPKIDKIYEIEVANRIALVAIVKIVVKVRIMVARSCMKAYTKPEKDS